MVAVCIEFKRSVYFVFTQCVSYMKHIGKGQNASSLLTQKVAEPPEKVAEPPEKFASLAEDFGPGISI